MALTTTTDEIEFDLSQLDDTLINDQQKQTLINYINQIKNEKRAINEDFNQLKLSTGQVKRRRTKRELVPMNNNHEQNTHFQTMLETLIYIVHEINIEQVKLTTTLNQLVQRMNQNEFYLNQLNQNIETLYEQFYNKQQNEIEPIVVEDQNQQPIDMSTTKKTSITTNKEYIELGDPSIGLSCLVLKRKYDQVRRRTELAYIHGEKRAIGRLLTFLIRQFFTNEELRNASLDGRVRNTQALAEDRMHIIDKHLQTIFGLDYNFYRMTKDCAEQVNVVCRHARNPKNFFDQNSKSEMKNNIINEPDLIEEKQFDEYESFQEQLFIQANDQRFHELAQEYDTVQNELVRQRELEDQLRAENEQLQKFSQEIEERLANSQQNEQQLTTKLESTLDQVRQLSTAQDQLKNTIEEQQQQIYELQKQRESLEEENRQVHNTNHSTITRLQELETTGAQLQSFESLWNKERELYTEQIQRLEQSLVESKKLSIEQQTQIMQLTVQLESSDGQLQAQKRTLDMSMDEKNEAILNLDRQSREKTQKIDQLQTDLQRTIRQMENQQITANKTIQSLKVQIDELSKKNTSITEKYDEQNQILAKITAERDMIKSEMRTVSETLEKQSTENDQTIRRLQDELDNTTQLLESIRSKGADLTQLTNFLDGTLSHIRSSDTSVTPSSTTTACSECRQLKSALVLELTGKERFRFGYEQLSAMVKEAAPILRRQKQDYEASFEVIAKLTSELNEARKELSELQQLSGESIENYRYIQRENQFLANDNKSLARQIQVLLSEIEEFRTGKRPVERETSPEYDPNQQVPLTFRNVVELQHVNQKLEKLVREMRTQSHDEDVDLNRTRFDELKKEHQQQQEKFKETKSQLDALETQMNSLIQERDFLRLLVSRSSSSQSTTSSSSSVDVHQVENLRDQVHRLQEKIEVLSNKNNQLTIEKDEQLRTSNEKIRSIQYELLTARTEVEQANEKFNLINNEHATNRLTIASLRTEINGWQERHSTLVQIRNKQEQQYFNILTELRQLKDEKASLECRISALENERRFDSIKYEQLENECKLLKNEISKNEQIQPVIEKLQTLAEYTKEKTQAMFEAKLNDLTAQNEQLRQQIEEHEREKEMLERTHQSRLDEITQTLQQEKSQHQECRTRFSNEKDKAENLQRQLNEIENKINSTSTQKTDIEQQLGDYEKQIKMLRVKLDAANNELELKQTLIQSGIDNANQLNTNGLKAIEELDKIKQEHAQKLIDYEQDVERLKQEIINHQSIIKDNEENIRLLNERIENNNDQYQIELKQWTDQIEQLSNEKTQLVQQMENIEQTLQENEQLKEKITQLEVTIEQDQMNYDEATKRYNDLFEQFNAIKNDNQRLLEQVQQADHIFLEKDELFRNQQELTQQSEQRYLELEQKHSEQHTLMIKLSTHLAAKESEATNSTDNETWNTILATNNYLRVENTRLTDELERIRLENAHLTERNTSLEQVYTSDQEMIEDLKTKNQSLQSLQEQFDTDQQQIANLHQKNILLEQEKETIVQDRQVMQKTLEQMKQEKQHLNEQVQQSQEKARANEEQLTVKTAEIQRQGREMDELKARSTKLESDNQELKQNNARLRQIAIKYKTTATAVTGASPAATPTATTTASTPSTETDDLLTTGSAETPANRPITADLTERMNKLREALIMARTTITTQQNRLSQMTSELARAKQSRIPTDQNEVQALVESIRQTYETEINDLKHIVQLFDNTDSNEQMSEIVRLRKKIEELTNNKSSTAKQSEDVTPKPTRPQAFASHTTQEPVISRVAPMAPGTGRRIGVAIPITASTTPTTTSAPLWTAGSNTETTTAQTAAPVEHPTTSQITTAAGVNLLMKRTRTDDPDQRTLESTLKRTKPETENTPLVAHVEPQVREQQQQQQQAPPVQEIIEMTETSVIDPTRTDVISIPIDSEAISSSIDESMSTTDSAIEIEPQSNIANTPAAIVVTMGETTSTTTTATTAISTSEQASDQRRGDILPIVYDVQSIPTIGSGGSTQVNRGGFGRPQRPLISIPATRRAWSARGAGTGRGGLGGRGAGGGNTGPPNRQ